MRELKLSEAIDVNAGLSFGKLIASITVGCFTGALRGIAGGPVGMIGGAIFGAGMGAAGCAITDAATLAEQKRTNDLIYL